MQLALGLVAAPLMIWSQYLLNSRSTLSNLERAQIHYWAVPRFALARYKAARCPIWYLTDALRISTDASCRMRMQRKPSQSWKPCWIACGDNDRASKRPCTVVYGGLAIKLLPMRR